LPSREVFFSLIEKNFWGARRVVSRGSAQRKFGFRPIYTTKVYFQLDLFALSFAATTQTPLREIRRQKVVVCFILYAVTSYPCN